jgi:hypothetical protein
MSIAYNCGLAVPLQELMWLVGTLVASKNIFDAERLLAGYVLTRRNALSSTAAVEYALIKVTTDVLLVHVLRLWWYSRKSSNRCAVQVLCCAALLGKQTA